MNRLRTQKIVLPEHDIVRVEIGFEFDPRIAPAGGPVLAVMAYDDPLQALHDACTFVETALAAVRTRAALAAREVASAAEIDAEQQKLSADWRRTMGASP